jgi:hypothetical protein
VSERKKTARNIPPITGDRSPTRLSRRQHPAYWQEHPLTYETFISAVVEWTSDKSKDPRLASNQQMLVKQGYELWLAAQKKGSKRSLIQFETELKTFDADLRPTSLWRKVKGQIRPRKEELRAFLTVIFSEGIPDKAARQKVIQKLIDVLTGAEPDLWTNEEVAWLFSGRSELVIGYRDERRAEIFRKIQGKRLFHLCRRLSSDHRGSDIPALPLTVWLLDARALFLQNADAYRCRNAIAGLVEEFMAVFANRLAPPRDDVGFYTTAPISSGISSVIDIAMDQGTEVAQVDLRHIFLRTSAVCLCGLPQIATERLRKELPNAKQAIKWPADKFAISLADSLMPETVLTRANVDSIIEEVAQRRLRIQFATDSGTIILGTKVSLDGLVELSKIAASRYTATTKDDLASDLATLHYAYWFEPGKQKEVEEVRLDVIPTPPTTDFALKLLLIGATAKLAISDSNDGITVGAESLDLLNRSGIAIMTIPEFFDFNHWFPLPTERNN